MGRFFNTLLVDKHGFTLSDATAYNIQFAGSAPVFIDHLSFRPYREGEIWAAHRQFCIDLAKEFPAYGPDVS